MLPIALFAVLLVASFVYALQHRAVGVSRNGARIVPTRWWPTTRIGLWSLGVLVAAGLFPLGLSAVLPYTYMGAPLAAIAFVLALVARVRYHDRSLLVLLSLVVGLLQALFPALFVLLQPAS
jgi:hypothetical protein